MSKFIKWVGEDGYTPAGEHRYTITFEDNLDQPRWWDPLLVPENPMHHYRELPSKFYHQGWMTKARAKEACEGHYIATYTEDEQ